MRRISTFVAAALAALALAGAALAQPARTLNFENMGGATTSATCTSSGSAVTLAYDASGTAAGSYTGTFVESGSVTAVDFTGLVDYFVTAFTAQFTIHADDGTVITGTKHFDFGLLSFPCSQFNVVATYEATIALPDGRTCADEGTSVVTVGSDFMNENFISSVGETVECAQALPTTKEQCKDGGWQTYGVFKNQGDCVSFVATKGTNGPGGP